jgi:hypothetical protein
VTDPAEMSFFARFFFAYACFFRVLFDGAFAGRALAVKEGMPALPPAPEKKPEPAEAKKPEPKPEPPKKPEPPSTDAALALLALLQREGRFVDFLEEDVASFPDADIGAAARVVHAGCRKALREHVVLEPIRSEEEGSKVTLPKGFDAAKNKLVGDVSGDGPFAGTLKHRGWRAVSVTLPTAMEGHDAKVVAQAEVEL